MKNLSTQKQKGFTLVETLFAILFLSLAITALLGTITQGSANARYVKDKTTALYLASEGLELATNWRDSYCFQAGSCTASNQNGGTVFDGFFTGLMPHPATSAASLSDCGGDPATDAGCSIGLDDPTNEIGMVHCQSVAVCTPLYLDTNNTGFFTYVTLSQQEKTIFTRRLYAAQLPAGNGSQLNMIHLICVVTWNDGSQNRSVTLSTDLFNRI